MRVRLCLAGIGLLLVPGLARATQALPIIVTYEMQRQREAARVQRRDPKAFWVHQIVARLEDRKPTGPLGLKEPATAKVRFVLDRDGRLVSKAIETSSGVPAVDKEAMALLERAQPFPPMPAALGESPLTFAVPLRFR